MSLTEGEGVLVYIFPRSEEDDPDAWNYPSSVDILHQRFIQDKVYEKQSLVTEEDVRGLYQLLHLGQFYYIQSYSMSHTSLRNLSK